ncbi:hypothetical protein WMY93_014441 [Mugilogobius chulae]|uniref:WD repeat domain 21 n=1 Tax=Mugilogobius chulae TaxID=88201 RepID=A0AAW0P1I9_9GOBI
MCPQRRKRSRNQRRRDNRREWDNENLQHVLRETESEPATSAPSSASSSSAAPELPGFYFDPEKNRYFRLLPGHNNCNPLTTEQLRQKEREKQRERSLAEDDNPRKKAPRPGQNMALLLQKRQFGTISGKSYCRLSNEVQVCGMKRQQLELVNANLMNKMLAMDSSCERVFIESDVSHAGAKYGLMNLSHSSRTQSPLTMTLSDNLSFTNRKVRYACWASVSRTDSHVLMCVIGSGDTPGCVRLLPDTFYGSSRTGPELLCSFNITSALTCAWCTHPHYDRTLSAGAPHRVIVKNVESGHTKNYDVNSDVLTQQFIPRSPVLFNGCRSGEIFGLDLRKRGGGLMQGWKTHRFQQESAITSLRVLNDHNYLLAADMLGQIKLWDARMSKSVQQYKGHYNEHLLLPVHVSEPEQLVLAVGQDCYTRIWSLQDGRLLRTIPSPHPVSNDLIPSVVFSSNLGGPKGPPGLLMSIKNDVFYFPYIKDSEDGG